MLAQHIMDNTSTIGWFTLLAGPLFYLSHTRWNGESPSAINSQRLPLMNNDTYCGSRFHLQGYDFGYRSYTVYTITIFLNPR